MLYTFGKHFVDDQRLLVPVVRYFVGKDKWQ